MSTNPPARRFTALTRAITGRVPLRTLVGVVWALIDAGAMALAALTVALLLRPDLTLDALALPVLLVIPVRLLFLKLFGLYRCLVRFSSLHVLGSLTGGVLTGSLLLYVVQDVIGTPWLSFLVFEGVASLVACGGMRIAVRLVYEWQTRALGTRVIVYGAGSLGEMVVRTLRRGAGFRPVGLLDDARAMNGSLIHGRRVWGGFAALPQVAKQLRAEMVVVAIRDLPPERLKEVFTTCMRLGLRMKKATGIDTMLAGRGELALDDIAIEDLLRRPARNLDPGALPAMLTGKTVVVTGAGGSIGSELCHQICMHGAVRIVLIDHSEPSLYAIEIALRDEFPDIDIEAVLLNLSYQAPLEALFQRLKPDVIFHAAAYKHVPLVEHNPILGVRNNIGGFVNVIEAAVAANVDRLVLISTDKAVRPTNVMGATKRVCELVLQNHPGARTRMCAVRFGNVLGSSGSVVPRFLEQIANGGPVTVTDKRMTRYFMLIPEAVELVLHAGALAEHGEIFILDMGEPVKIDDMARQLIFMTGHVPDVDIPVVYSGLRPGEKLYEELLMNEAEHKTCVEGITVGRPTQRDYTEIKALVTDLMLACESQNPGGLIKALKALVPEWQPSEAYRKYLDGGGRDDVDSRRMAAVTR